MLHARGYRYRVDTRPVKTLNRRADIVFPKERLAVFVDGCFWHGCQAHYQAPAANFAYWRAKVEANARRDRQTDRLLRRSGWSVVRIWEHSDLDRAATRVERLLSNRRSLAARSKTESLV
jgi:DNA mismatch endonuclease (patch repair protein)